MFDPEGMGARSLSESLDLANEELRVKLADQEDRAYRLRQRLQDILDTLKTMKASIDNEVWEIDEVLRRTK